MGPNILANYGTNYCQNQYLGQTKGGTTHTHTHTELQSDLSDLYKLTFLGESLLSNFKRRDFPYELGLVCFR